LRVAFGRRFLVFLATVASSNLERDYA
jgi:hypothetical protein